MSEQPVFKKLHMRVRGSMNTEPMRWTSLDHTPDCRHDSMTLLRRSSVKYVNSVKQSNITMSQTTSLTQQLLLTNSCNSWLWLHILTDCDCVHRSVCYIRIWQCYAINPFQCTGLCPSSVKFLAEVKLNNLHWTVVKFVTQSAFCLQHHSLLSFNCSSARVGDNCWTCCYHALSQTGQ